MKQLNIVPAAYGGGNTILPRPPAAGGNCNIDPAAEGGGVIFNIFMRKTRVI